MSNSSALRAILREGIQGYHPSVARALDSVSGAIFVEHIAFWQSKSDDGWAYRTQEEIEERTALQVRHQHRIRKQLRESGVLQEVKRGVPQRLYYRLDYDNLEALLQSGQNVHSEPDKVATLNQTDCPDYISKEVSKDLYIKGVEEQFGEIPDDTYACLSRLAELDGYPKQIKSNIEHIEKLKVKHPDVYLPKHVDDFCDYYEEQGFKSREKPRGKLTQWMIRHRDWSKQSNGSVKSEQKPRVKEYVN